MDYDMARRYFNPETGNAQVWIGVIGFVIAAFGGSMFVERSSSSTALPNRVGAVVLVVVGLAMVALAVILYRRARRGGVSVADYDQLVMAEAHRSLTAAPERLTLSDEHLTDVGPLLIVGYDFQASTLKRTDGGRTRGNMVETMAVYFSDDALHAYKRTFSTTQPGTSYDAIDEVFYRDVVSISTGAGKVGNSEFEQFSITTSGGTQIACAISDPGSAAETIAAARRLVMDKKRGAT